MQYEIEIGGRSCWTVVHRADSRFVVALDGHETQVDAVHVDGCTWSLLIDGRSFEVTIAGAGGAGEFAVGVDGVPVAACLNARMRRGRKEEGGSARGPHRVVAPMPGRVLRVLVRPGDVVRARQPLVVIEAMKMENELRAPGAATVAEIHAVEGQSVDAGALLAVLAGGD